MQNYGTLSENLHYKKAAAPIYESAEIDNFIAKVDPKELEKAIRTFTDSSRAEYKNGGVVTIEGKKVKISFESFPKEHGAYRAVFQFVDNQDAAKDLSDVIHAAIAGLGTDEDTIYSVAAAFRSYCQETGKDEYAEMLKLQQEYFKKYQKNLEKDLEEELVDDTFTTEEFNLFIKGLFLIGPREDVGQSRATRLADFTKPDFATRMLKVDINHNNAIEFILGCPLKYLRVIDGALRKDQTDILTLVKKSNHSSDVKDVINYYLMGAALNKKNDYFTSAYRIAAEGRAPIDPAYNIPSYSGVM